MKKIGIVSYPKSGNTWMRFLIANLFYTNEITYENINDYVSTGNQLPKKNSHNFFFYKTHKKISSKILDEYDKVIYIIRNGDNVARSYYSFVRAQNPMLIDNENEFIRIHSAYYGSWGSHVLTSLKNVCENTYVVFYEDLIENPSYILKEILDFLGAKELESRIEISIRNCSKDKMSKLEGSMNFINSKCKKGNYKFANTTNRTKLDRSTMNRWYAILENKIAQKTFYSIESEVSTVRPLAHGRAFKYFFLIRQYLRLNFPFTTKE